MLQGSLENFELSDVLGLLAATSKSGRLRLTGDRGTGSLWLENGSLVNGIVGVRTDAPIEEMVFELMRFTAGEFAFSADERPVQPGEARPVAAVVAEASSRLGEWRTIEAVVPSLAHTLEPVAELPAAEMVITRSEWEVLLAVGPMASVGTVCAILGLGEVDGSRQVKELVDRGLLSVGEPPASSSPHGTPAHGIRVHEAPARELSSYEESFETPVPAAEQLTAIGDDVIAFEGAGDGHPIESPASAADLVARAVSVPHVDAPAEDQGFVFDASPEDAGFVTAAPPATERARTPMPPPPPPAGFNAGLGATVTPPWGEERRAQPDAWRQDVPPNDFAGATGTDSGWSSESVESEWAQQGDWDTGSDWKPAAIPAPPAGFAAAGIGAVPPPPPPPFVAAPAPLDPSDFADLIDDDTDGTDDSGDHGGGSLLMRYLKSER